MNRKLFNATDLGMRDGALTTTNMDQSFGFRDMRVARLLLVLNELDAGLAGLRDLPKPDLTDLVSSAIVACGFTDPEEIRSAIVEVLQAIEVPGLRPGDEVRAGDAWLS